MHDVRSDFEKILVDDFRKFGTSGTVYEKTSMLCFINDVGLEGNLFLIADFHVHK